MKSLIVITLILVILSLALGIGAYRRVSVLQSELSNLKAENEKLSAVVNDLKKRFTIGSRQIPLQKRLKIGVNRDKDHIKGDPNAPITLIEFCDYESRDCRAFHWEVKPEIEEKYITTGKVRYVFKDFPNNKSGKTFPAANAVLCAGEQDKYWDMQDFIFKSPENLDMQRILSASGELGLTKMSLRRV